MDSMISSKLAEPVFEFSEQAEWRSVLAANLSKFDALQAAFYSGLQAATPGMAFLFGYQCAIRRLDPKCSADTLAAFVVSESGVKSPRDMQAALSKTEQGLQLDGQKSHVMLMPDLLDVLYLVVKQGETLVGIQLPAGSDGIAITKQLQIPFVSDIPHAAISLQRVAVTDDALMAEDGHGQWNKPFRYWEDMHVAAAMLAWMYRHTGKKYELLVCWQQLQRAFEQAPEYYVEQSFGLLDSVFNVLDETAKGLEPNCFAMWKADRMLLAMGSNIRSRVKAKLFT